jgi:cell division protein FtsB
MEDDMHLYEPIGFQGGQKLHASNETERISITSFNDGEEYTYMSQHGSQQKESSLKTAISMEDDMHLYEPIGFQGGQKLHASNETERISITSFNDGEEYTYMSQHGSQQKESSEYQQPQQLQCSRTDTKTAVKNDDAKGASDCHVLKEELRQTKVCLCALSLLIVILFLITVSSLGLAAYCLGSIRSGNDLEYRLNTINSEATSQRTFINNLESQLNTISAEVTSQRTFVNTLNSQLNGIDSAVSTVRSSVTSLQNQLILTNSSLQVALRSQPSE